MNEQTLDQLHDYINDCFGLNDDVFRDVQAEAERNHLPTISVKAFEGRVLQLLVMLIGAKKIVEIGTLAGYSGIWMARGLPVDGKLYTIEQNVKHASIATHNFERAGVSAKVEILVNNGKDALHYLTKYAPFDAIFIDADKANYPLYLEWAAQNLRKNGIVMAHNAFRHGAILDPQSEDDHTMVTFNEQLAHDSRFIATIFPIGDGLAVGVRQ